MSLPIHKKHPSDCDIKHNVESNVHTQVHQVMSTFKKEVKHDGLNVFVVLGSFDLLFKLFVEL
jgi:hypothetical protein